jgi:uncharacterized protein (TIRG00374 family)
MRSRKNKTKWILRLIGPLLFIALVISRINIGEALNVASNARIGLLVIAIFVFPLPIPLRAWRWKLLMDKYAIHYGWSDALVFYLVGYAGQFFLPTGLGDSIRVLYLIEDSYSVRQSFVTIVWDKSFEIATTLLFGLLGAFVFPAFLELDRRTLTLFLLAFVLPAFIVIGFRHRAQRKISQIARSYLSKQARRVALSVTSDLINDFRRITVVEIGAFLLMSLGIGFIHYFSFFMITLSLGLDLSLVQVLATMGIMGLATNTPFLSLSIGGIGVRDGALYVLLTALGRSAEAAIALSVLILFTSALWHVVALGAWLKRPVSVNEIMRRMRAAAKQRPNLDHPQI